MDSTFVEPPSASTPALTLDNLTTVGGLLGVLDREAQTLDVSRQMQGPRWNLRQWAEYWKDRKPSAKMKHKGMAEGGDVAVEPPAVETGVVTMTGHLMERAASEAAAARGMSSSSHGEGQDGGEMDDEADSAWVHGKG